MFVQIKCSFCDQAFDYDSSGEGLPADCPHCGKRNTAAARAGAPNKDMTIQHDAPSLAGGRLCPSCKTQIARDAVLCIHCGYNLATGKKVGASSWFSANRKPVSLLLGGLVLVALAAAYPFWPEPEVPIPFVPSTEPAATPPAQPAPPPAIPAATNIAAEPVAPAPPPGPSPEELVAKQAEAERVALEAQQAQAAAERAAFEAKKVQAEQTFRQQLDAREPLCQTNETVELRRKNGLVDKGTFTGFSGTGTGRVALVATFTGQIGVPLVALDTPSRCRLDPEFRDAFIQHMLNMRLPAAPAGPPEE